MFTSPSFFSPRTADGLQPSPTPPPWHHRSVERNRIRQVNTDEVAAAKQQCQSAGNNVISCFPTADTVVSQHQFANFVWNSRRPQLIQAHSVDIFLFRGDSQQILHFHNIVNPSSQAGSLSAQVNDTWLGSEGTKWNGQNISYPFYWVIIASNEELDGSQPTGATFHAVQTTFADSVISTSTSTSSGGTPSSGTPNGSHSATSFPRWAIAVIVVLGFLAVSACCILIFARNRRRMVRSSLEDELSMGVSQSYVGMAELPPAYSEDAMMARPYLKALQTMDVAERPGGETERLDFARAPVTETPEFAAEAPAGETEVPEYTEVSRIGRNIGRTTAEKSRIRIV